MAINTKKSLKDVTLKLSKKLFKAESQIKEIQEILIETAVDVIQHPQPQKGEKGDKGNGGERGVRGFQGLKGDKGTTGERGERGDKGGIGFAGREGTDGADGTNGIDGEDGKDGKDGQMLIKNIHVNGGGGGNGGGVRDHTRLSNLAVDDHKQYSLVSGVRAFTGTVGGITPVAASDLATKNYVDTFAGSTSITTLGTVTAGTWEADTIGVAFGGTGQTSYTDGQLLIGNTTGNTLTKATLTGTSNQITITNGSGTIILSTPQDIATTSNVTFGNLDLGVDDTGVSSFIKVFGGGAGQVEGGEIQLYVSADHDAIIDFYRIDVTNDRFRIGREGAEDLCINIAGNIVITNKVGIGTNSPDSTLEVVTSTNDEGYQLTGADIGVTPTFKIADAAGIVRARIGIAGGPGELTSAAVADDLIIRSESNAIHFSISSNTVLTVDNNQRVGIGAATPASTLEVKTSINDQGIQLTGADTGVSPVFKIADAGGTVRARIGIAGAAGELSGGAKVDDLVFRTEAKNFCFTVSSLAKAVLTANGDWGLGSTVPPTAGGGKVFFLGDNTSNPTMGSNTAGIFAKDVAGTVELFAIDEANNATQLSAHDPKTGKYYYSSVNSKTGREVTVDMEGFIKDYDKRFGTSFFNENKPLQV